MRPTHWLCAFALAAAFLGPAAHAQPVKIGNWEIDVYPNKGGPPQGCLMLASYKSGATLGIEVSKSYEWGLGLFNESWNLAPDGSTPVAVYVDKKFLIQGNARHVAKTLALLPLTSAGAAGFQALRAGHLMEMQTPYGKLAFSLEGTARAMLATVQCVDILNGRNNPSPPVAAAEQPQVQIVSQAEATVMLTNILNAAGISGYRLQPPAPNKPGTDFVLADGTQGVFVAGRGNTREADDYAAWWIGELSQECKGDFASGKQTVPSTDGSVIRKVVTTCRNGSATETIESTIIRRPNGFLMNLSHTLPAAGTTLREGPPAKEREAVIDAALRLPEAR